MTNKYITNYNITNSTVNININNYTEKSNDNISIPNKESTRLLNNSPPNINAYKITPVKEFKDNNETDSFCSLICVKNKDGMYELHKSTKLSIELLDLNTIEKRKAFQRMLLLRKANDQHNNHKCKIDLSNKTILKEFWYSKQNNNPLLHYKNYVLQRNNEYYQKHKDKILRYNIVNQRKYNKNEIDNNLMSRLVRNNKHRINVVLKFNNITRNSDNLLACSKYFYYQWIFYQSPYPMNDDDFRKDFEIDHVKPIASFNLSDKESQYQAFKWENSRPLLIIKNRRKGAKRDLWAEIMQELKSIIFLKYQLLFG